METTAFYNFYRIRNKTTQELQFKCQVFNILHKDKKYLPTFTVTKLDLKLDTNTPPQRGIAMLLDLVWFVKAAVGC